MKGKKKAALLAKLLFFFQTSNFFYNFSRSCPSFEQTRALCNCFWMTLNSAVQSVMVSMSGGAWSEISRGAAVKHFVMAALWYFLRGAALQHLSSGGAALTFFVGAT